MGLAIRAVESALVHSQPDLPSTPSGVVLPRLSSPLPLSGLHFYESEGIHYGNGTQ